MADVAIHVGRVHEVRIVPVGGLAGGVRYTAVFLRGDDACLHLSTIEPRVVERGRMVAHALLAACDALEDAERRATAVPIEDLAPDGTATIEGVGMRVEDDIELARRRVGSAWRH